MEFKPALTFNCPGNWDKMKIGLVSRNCENCKRDIKDFTSLSRDEILQVLWANRNEKVCGRILKSQLDYHHEEILVTIEGYLRTNRNSNLSFYLLAAATMALLSCSTNSNEGRSQQGDSLAMMINGIDTQTKDDQIQPNNSNCNIDKLPVEEFTTVGIIVPHESSTVNANGVRILAEVMPEFIGGFDSLTSYIKRNLKYPEWERKAGIEGNVFVSFTIDEEGKITDPEILRSVAGAKYFDAEVLRLIKGMPNWKPGREEGQNVAVQMTLPIKFKL